MGTSTTFHVLCSILSKSSSSPTRRISPFASGICLSDREFRHSAESTIASGYLLRIKCDFNTETLLPTYLLGPIITCSYPAACAGQESNLLAAGHDGGMIVFKLERERPAYAPLANSVLFLKDRYVRLHEYSSGKDTPLMSIRRSSNCAARSVMYNEQENMLLICLDAEGGSYELYHIPQDSRGAETGNQECKRGLGTSAVFVARQRFAVLDKNRQILVKNFQNEVTKKCAPPYASTDYLFTAGTGSLLLRSEDRITLFDIQQRKAMAELNTPGVIKYVVWSHDMSRVALLSKHGIIIATRKLEQVKCAPPCPCFLEHRTWGVHVVHGLPVYSSALFRDHKLVRAMCVCSCA